MDETQFHLLTTTLYSHIWYRINMHMHFPYRVMFTGSQSYSWDIDSSALHNALASYQDMWLLMLLSNTGTVLIIGNIDQIIKLIN